MSGSTGGIIFRIGVVVVAMIIPGGQAAAMAVLVVGNIAAELLFPPKAGDKPEDADPNKSPRFSGCGYGTVIPAIVGRARLEGYFIEGNAKEWLPIPIEKTYETPGSFGKMSKKSMVASYNYRWRWSVLYGTAGVNGIDAVRRVWVVPSEYASGPAVWENFGDADYLDIEIDSRLEEGPFGAMRIYRGRSVQTRIETDDVYGYTGMNYRRSVWAHFNITLGVNNPSVPSMSIEVWKQPEVPEGWNMDLENWTLDGSNLPSANAAAAILHIMTQAGTPVENFDQESWEAASHVCDDLNIGLNGAFKAVTKLSELVSSLAQQSGLWIYEKHGIMYCVSQFDYTNRYRNIRVVTSDHYTGLRVARSTRKGAPNVFVCSWENPARNYQYDVYEFVNEANVAEVGERRIGLSFDNVGPLEAVHRMASNAAHIAADPKLDVQFDSSPSLSHLSPGDSFILQFGSEYSALPSAALMICTGVSRPDARSDLWKVSAMSDPQGQIHLGNSRFIPPRFRTPWASASTPLESEIYEFTDREVDQEPLIYRAVMAIPQALGVSGFIVAGDRPSGGSGIHVTANGESLGVKSSFAIPAHLSTPLSAGGQPIVRGEAFRLTPVRSWQGSEVISRLVGGIGDSANLVSLIADRRGVIIMGNEIIHVGMAVILDSGEVSCRNVVRGGMGTQILTHTVNTMCMVVGDLTDSYFYETSGLMTGVVAVATELATGGSVRIGEGNPAQVDVDDVIKPFAPLLIQAELSGSNYLVTLRPRWQGAGAGFDAFETVYTSLNGLSFAYRLNSGALTTLSVDTTWLADMGTVTGTIPGASDLDALEIYQVYKGVLSDPLGFVI